MSAANNILVRKTKVDATENVTFSGAIFDWHQLQILNCFSQLRKVFLQLFHKSEKTNMFQNTIIIKFLKLTKLQQKSQPKPDLQRLWSSLFNRANLFHRTSLVIL